MLKLNKSTLTSFILSTICSVGLASEPGFFIGWNIIGGSVDADNLTIDDTDYAVDGNSSYGTGFNMGGWGEYVGWEWGINYLSKINYKDSNDLDRMQPFTYMAFIPHYQFGNITILGRAGGAFVYNYTHSSDLEYSQTEMALAALAGVGVGYNVSPSLEIDLSYNRLFNSSAPANFGMLEFTHHSVTLRNEGGFLID